MAFSTELLQLSPQSSSGTVQPPKGNLPLEQSLPAPSHSLCNYNLLSACTDLPLPDMSHKRAQTLWDLLRQAPLTSEHVFGVHLCCGLHQTVTPLYGRGTLHPVGRHLCPLLGGRTLARWHILTVVSNAAGNPRVQVCVWTCGLSSPGEIPGCGLPETVCF